MQEKLEKMSGRLCHKYIYTMAIRVMEFLKGYKIRKIFALNLHTQRKFLNFENWTNGEPQ